MNYEEKDVVSAFKLYSDLACNGHCLIKDYSDYLVNDAVRGLLDLYSEQVNSAVIVTSDQILLIPLVAISPFHVSNERIRRDYLTSKHQVGDVYLLYFSVIVFFGLFYDSYHTTETVLDFVSMNQWLEAVSAHILTLSEHDTEKLSYYEKDLNYNWRSIIDKWNALDDTNENVKVQDGRTSSRISFLNLVKTFLLDQECLIELGNFELGLTDQAKDIVSKYYMELEYNRGILELIYKEADHGDDFKDAVM
jgi:hypothetical protein